MPRRELVPSPAPAAVAPASAALGARPKSKAKAKPEAKKMPRPVSVQTSVSAAPPSGASPGSRAAYTKQLPQRDPLTKKPRVGPVELSRPPSEDESWGTWEAGGGARPEVATAHPAVAQQAQRSAAAASPTDMPVPLSPPPLPENECTEAAAASAHRPPRSCHAPTLHLRRCRRPPRSCAVHCSAAHREVAPPTQATTALCRGSLPDRHAGATRRPFTDFERRRWCTHSVRVSTGPRPRACGD
jgi:hypothetical protein